MNDLDRRSDVPQDDSIRVFFFLRYETFFEKIFFTIKTSYSIHPIVF